MDATRWEIFVDSSWPVLGCLHAKLPLLLAITANRKGHKRTGSLFVRSPRARKVDHCLTPRPYGRIYGNPTAGRGSTGSVWTDLFAGFARQRTEWLVGVEKIHKVVLAGNERLAGRIGSTFANRISLSNPVGVGIGETVKTGNCRTFEGLTLRRIMGALYGKSRLH